MDLSTILSPQQRLSMDSQIDTFNKSLGRTAKTVLDREDFLQILITQLTHQDPTSPMEDREFVAQMAHFSTLFDEINVVDHLSTDATVTEIVKWRTDACKINTAGHYDHGNN